LTYTTRSGSSHYLRLVTLENFTGAAWVPDEPKQRRTNDVQAFSAPVGLSPDIRTSTEVTRIAMGNLRSPWLPLPYPTSSVTGLWGDWYWESGSLAVSSPDAVLTNQRYEAHSLVLRPTPQQLSAAGRTVPASMHTYLSLPADLPAIISDTARNVTAGESSSYAEAIALQEYFRSDVFQYSVEAPIDDGYDGTGMDVIARFLEAKSGYCVHFASAMAVMARSLGIPARIAVGFQGGTVMDTDSSGQITYRVTTQDLHAWPRYRAELRRSHGCGCADAHLACAARGRVHRDPGSQHRPKPTPRPAGRSGFQRRGCGAGALGVDLGRYRHHRAVRAVARARRGPRTGSVEKGARGERRRGLARGHPHGPGCRPHPPGDGHAARGRPRPRACSRRGAAHSTPRRRRTGELCRERRRPGGSGRPSSRSRQAPRRRGTSTTRAREVRPALGMGSHAAPLRTERPATL